MKLTDTHTHLFLEDFAQDIAEVLARAETAGVQRFYLPNIDSSTTPALLELAANYPESCFPMMGLHPCSVKRESFEEELRLVEEAHSKQKFWAVGETGIDLHWDATYLEEQQEAFRRQVRLAKSLALPVVIHVRKSFDEVASIIEEENDDTLTGIFHCFSGTAAQAMRIIGFGGFKLGIGGVLTYKNSGLAEVVRDIDLRHLVLETDSPYLTPAPHRGQRNESSYLIYIAEKLAQVKGISTEEVAETTSANAQEVFGT